MGVVEPEEQERTVTPKRLATILLCALVALAAWLVLSGCAAKRRPQASAPAPAAVDTTQVRRAVEVTRQHGLNAQTRVQTVLREIERIKLVADPATVMDLEKLRLDLQGADEELSKLRLSVEQAQGALLSAEQQAATLREWGITQQGIADANADGWRAEEQQRLAAVADRDKARAVANKRGNLVGTLGAASLGFLALKFVTFAVPWTMVLPVLGSLAGYFGARFIL